MCVRINDNPNVRRPLIGAVLYCFVMVLNMLLANEKKKKNDIYKLDIRHYRCVYKSLDERVN